MRIVSKERENLVAPMIKAVYISAVTGSKDSIALPQEPSNEDP